MQPEMAGVAQMTYRDLTTYRRWNLLAHLGSVTLPHIDSEGYCTFTQVVHGVKTWAVVKLKEATNHPQDFDLNQLMEQMHTFNPDVIEMHIIHLPAGALMCVDNHPDLLHKSEQHTRIQPPNCWHAVYTPCKALCMGGHFLNLRCLSATRRARYLVGSGYVTSNADHIGVDINIQRMFMAMVATRSSEDGERCCVIQLHHV